MNLRFQISFFCSFQIKREKSAKRKEAREKAQREEKERAEHEREMAAKSRAVTTTSTWRGMPAGKSAPADKRTRTAH